MPNMTMNDENLCSSCQLRRLMFYFPLIRGSYLCLLPRFNRLFLQILQIVMYKLHPDDGFDRRLVVYYSPFAPVLC